MFLSIVESTLLIFGVALASSLASNFLIMKKVDLQASNEVMKAYQEFVKEYRQALSEGDRDRLEKLEKKQKQLQDLVMKVQMDRLKVSLYLLIPFLILFYVLAMFFGSSTVAISPFRFHIFYFVAYEPVRGGWGMNFVTWYVISSLFTNTIIGKAMKVVP
ncbi:MAG: EMC3/TMCO1 family protein [Nitrososphaeria archaeon]